MGVGEISVASVFEFRTSSCLSGVLPLMGGALDFADRCGGFKKFDVILLTGAGVLRDSTLKPPQIAATIAGHA